MQGEVRTKKATKSKRCECGGKGYVIRNDSEGVYALAVECSGCATACKACGGVGSVFFKVGNYSYARDCECTTKQRHLEAFNRAKLPSLYSGSVYTLESYQVDRPGSLLSKVYNYVESYCKVFADDDLFKKKPMGSIEEGVECFDIQGLILYGPPGVGKTHLIVSMLKELTLTYGRNCRFVEFSHLIKELKATFDDPHKSSTSIINEILKGDIIFIDELGKGRQTDWQKEVLDELISKMYNTRKILIATSNLVTKRTSPERIYERTFQEVLDPRVYSRLHEMAVHFRVEGRDYREVRGDEMKSLLLREMQKQNVRPHFGEQ